MTSEMKMEFVVYYAPYHGLGYFLQGAGEGFGGVADPREASKFSTKQAARGVADMFARRCCNVSADRVLVMKIA